MRFHRKHFPPCLNPHMKNTLNGQCSTTQPPVKFQKPTGMWRSQMSPQLESHRTWFQEISCRNQLKGFSLCLYLPSPRVKRSVSEGFRIIALENDLSGNFFCAIPLSNRSRVWRHRTTTTCVSAPETRVFYSWDSFPFSFNSRSLDFFADVKVA